MRGSTKIVLALLFGLLIQSLMVNVQPNGTPLASSVVIDRNSQILAQQPEGPQSSRNLNDSESLCIAVNNTLFKGGFQVLQSFQSSSIPSFTYNVMCKGFYSTMDGNFPITPTTIFGPSDEKAVCLMTASVSNTIAYQWYYRNYSSKTWTNCYNWSQHVEKAGPISYEGHLWIAGYAPAVLCPRAFKVEVYLDGLLACTDFFEVTTGGLDSPRTCGSIASGYPVNVKSRFTLGSDQEVCYFLRFDQVAYFDEDLGRSHSFTTVWVQPDGSVYKTYSDSFPDYKDSNLTWNCWQNYEITDDYLPINSSTPLGNWTVELYLDNYFNQTWMPYGPIAVTPFIVGSANVSDWTFMAYLDGDNSGESAAIDTFLEISSVGSSSQVNVVVQTDRIAGWWEKGAWQDDVRFDNWTDCKRFYVTTNMTPTSGNATMDLGEVDMGAPETLRDFVNWTICNYPANHYALVLCDHGAGCFGCCEDYTNGNDSLTLPGLSRALSNLPTIIDVVLFDACSMNMAEVAYQIRDYANIMVGPEALGYAPGPYDAYLSTLISDSSISPNALATEIVKDYMVWCNNVRQVTGTREIPNATISAIDLTEITSLTSAMNDFALRLEQKETPYDEQINLARNLTEEYPGPTSGDEGYYIDLYTLAQLISQNVPDKEIQDAASRMMTAISAATLIAENISLPNSHGLAVFFPADEGKYNTYKIEYENTSFSNETVWNDFLENHFSGCLVTIQTSPSYPNIPIMVGNDSYTSDANGRVQVFVMPGSYTFTGATSCVIAQGARGIFIQWENGESSNPRTLYINGTTTISAKYQIQYQLAIATNYGTTDPSIGLHWFNANSTFQIDATAPGLIFSPTEEQFVLIKWNGTGIGSYGGTDNSAFITMNGPVNETVTWRHEYYLNSESLYGSPSISSGWFDADATITVSVAPPISEPTDTQYICVGWNETGNVTAEGTASSANVTISGPLTMTWKWKTQFHIYVHTEPAGMTPQPVTSSPGPWYDNGTMLLCTAQNISGRVFDHWSVDGVNYYGAVNPVSISVDGPHTAVAHYLPAPAWWENLFGLQPLQGILMLSILFSGSVAGGVWIWTRRIREKRLHPERFPLKIPKIVLPDRVSTGSKDVDNLLCGGLPHGYSVALTSPSCDERDSLIKGFLEVGAERGEITFYVTADPGEMKTFAERYPSNFYLFLCNPRADTIIESLPNVFRLKGVENLTEVVIAMTKAFRGLDAQQRDKRACIGILSDVLLSHHALQTRRWLTDLIPDLRSKGFTTLAPVNLSMHPPEEVQAILEVFEGQIAIYEKDGGNGPQRFLRVKKMTNQKYFDYELAIRKNSSERQKDQKTD